jgi:hypothetical protein
MPRFTYSEHQAKAKHDAIDLRLGQIENRIEWLRQVVPAAGAIPSRLDDAIEEIQGVAADLHDLVDERTDSPSSTAAGSSW